MRCINTADKCPKLTCARTRKDPHSCCPYCEGRYSIFIIMLTINLASAPVSFSFSEFTIFSTLFNLYDILVLKSDSYKHLPLPFTDLKYNVDYNDHVIIHFKCFHEELFFTFSSLRM